MRQEFVKDEDHMRGCCPELRKAGSLGNGMIYSRVMERNGIWLMASPTILTLVTFIFVRL